MDFVLYNIRLKELVSIVQENRCFFEEFIHFLQEEGYNTIHDFIKEPSDQKAVKVISKYLVSPSQAVLYDGILRPYPDATAKWFFMAWLLRDAATQRLQPLLKRLPGKTLADRKTYLLNELRKYVEPLFPESASWEWPAISEIMLTRLEGSRRALKGALLEEIVRRNINALIQKYDFKLEVSEKQVKIHEETYDVQVIGSGGSILIPVKTRETMGGGHALLFTRDIYKSIMVATEQGYKCIPIVIAESWIGDLDALGSELYIYIQVNPNQIATVESFLVARLEELVPLFNSINI